MDKYWVEEVLGRHWRGQKLARALMKVTLPLVLQIWLLDAL